MPIFYFGIILSFEFVQFISQTSGFLILRLESIYHLRLLWFFMHQCGIFSLEFLVVLHSLIIIVHRNILCILLQPLMVLKILRLEFWCFIIGSLFWNLCLLWSRYLVFKVIIKILVHWLINLLLIILRSWLCILLMWRRQSLWDTSLFSVTILLLTLIIHFYL